jgi:hypothetical protein
MRKRLSLLAAVAVLALAGPALAGCAKKNHGPGVATLGDGGSASASAKGGGGDAREQGHKFAECMREQGIDMPDPEVGDDGGMRVQIGSDGDATGKPPPDLAKVDAAQAKCKQYLPNGGEPPKLDPAQIEQARQFSRCMRENGVPNFPDPDANGMLRIEAGGDSGIDPQKVEDAQKKCDQYAPKRKGSDSGGVTGGGGQGPGGGLGGNG